MKKKGIIVLLTALFLLGFCLLIYPVFSHYWNDANQSKLIVSYENNMEGLTDQKEKKLFEEASAYNKRLSKKADRWNLSEKEVEEYTNCLSMDGSEVMSYIDIPALNCQLPIYHGTEDGLLQAGAGHLMGSSLPVGGEGSHCVIAGHRGLSNAALFTDLDKLSKGDMFSIYTLGEELVYEVDQIRIVEPDDFSYLQIEEGMDLCTLVTCTPKDVNTQRLLVRGHRVHSPDEEYHITKEAVEKDPDTVAAVLCIPLLFLSLLITKKRLMRNVDK